MLLWQLEKIAKELEKELKELEEKIASETNELKTFVYLFIYLFI